MRVRTCLRTAILVAAVLAALSLVEGFLASAGGAARANAPQATAAKAWTFSGRGPKKLGTFRLRRAATLRWRSSGGQFLIVDSRGFRLLYTRARRGKLKVRSGTYRSLSLSASGSWRVTIAEKRH